MRDERTDASAAFALRIAANLVTALVLKGVLTRENAASLVDESLASLVQTHPDHEASIREIAGVMTVQTELAWGELQRQLKKG